MANKRFDRSKKDVGNILAMEHVNVAVPDQALATLFYVNSLGFTRDPYMDFGLFNVWINVGQQQFHLPTGDAQVLRGRIGVVVPSLDELEDRLNGFAKLFAGTKFKAKRQNRHLDATCPWGNRIRCHAPGRHGSFQLGMPYVEFEVPEGASAGIARFYETVFSCRASLGKRHCDISVGQEQFLRFRETGNSRRAYDGHHIAIYVANFSRPHAFLSKNGLVTEESDDNQYRFQAIIDPDTGERLFDIEHEVRCMHHPMFNRRLVNRDAAQGVLNYQPHRDAFVPDKPAR